MVIVSTLMLLASLASSLPILRRSISEAPVILENFPDPSFIKVGNRFYAFATNSGGRHVPMAQSDDFAAWSITPGHDALPRVGAWSNGNDIWAPDVVQLEDGSFVMYYTGASKSAPGHCIGAATSKTVEGPYEAVPDPLACHTDRGGAIDPAGFLDADGKRYVVYKIDGNSIGNGGNCNNGVEPLVPTPIMLQEVTANGLNPVGDPQQILDRGQYDGPLVEAPSLTRVEDPSSAGGWLYILFFSSNCYAGPLYDSSYAISTNGIKNGGVDYQKSSAPLLVTGSFDNKLYSPGGLDVEPDASKVLFHAGKGKSADVRQMWTGQITVDVPGRKVSI